jgi:hypothetical protein
MASPGGASSDDSNDPPTSAPPRQPTVGAVLRRIVSIIGVYPSRTYLIYFWNALHWGPLGRTEKRVKSALLQKLESLHDRILPTLETPDGREKLQDAYVSILRSQRDHIAVRSVPAFSPVPHPGE